MKKPLFALALLCSVSTHAQTITGMDQDGSFRQYDEQGNLQNNNRGFNPNRTDSTKKSKTIPKGIYVWRVDRKLGDIIKAEVDTMPHLYPNSTMAMAKYGEYNTIGSNYSARMSRIFINRPETDQAIFTQLYSQVLKTPDQWHFTNTLSPITNLSYDNSGGKQNGEDHLDAKFAVNVGKKIGIGFDLDYDYARGFFQNQSISHFNATVYGSYHGDKYQMHLLYSRRHQKNAENGGIANDDYILHKELFPFSYSDEEIPVILASNWNRNDSHNLFLTHRYSLGFYREVRMTEEEIKAKEFAEKSKRELEKKQKKTEMPSGRDTSKPVAEPKGRPEGAAVMGEEPKDLAQAQPADSLAADTTRIKVDSKEMADSLLAAEAVKDSLAKYMKKEFVPVTNFIHTFELSQNDHIYQAYSVTKDYFSNTYYKYVDGTGYAGDSIYDRTKYFLLRNTVGLGLLEGFNKWAKAGIRVFATHEFRQFTMPEMLTDDVAYISKWTEHNVSVGGRIVKTQGKTLHYNLSAETWLIGKDAGQLRVDFDTDLNFKLWGDTLRLAAKGYLHRINPTFYERHFHSKHLWWDNSLDQMTRLRAEGVFSYEKTHTTLRVAIEEIKNYTYFSMNYNRNSAGLTGLTTKVNQSSTILNVLTAQLDQKLSVGPLHWDNILTYQSSSNSHILPLPTLNIFSNLYLKFLYAKVLTIELGGTATYFTAYCPPDFAPQLNQFAIQENEDNKVKLGNFPFVDVYANLHLKHARFFIIMSNVFGKTLNRMTFLTPHYPVNRSVMRIGISWNFFN